MTDNKPRSTLIVASLMALSAALASAASAQTPRFPITREAPRGEGLRMPKPSFPIRNPSAAETVAASTPSYSPPPSISGAGVTSTAIPDAAPSTVRAPTPVTSRELAPLEPVSASQAPDNGSFEIALAQTRSRRSGSAVRETSASEYTVKRGDNLASIARSLGVTQDALAEANGLRSPYRLDAGQKLKVPGASGGLRGAVSSEAASSSYKVQRGDTLASIAKAQGVSIEDIAAANGLSSPYRLTAGQTLKVPGGEEPARSNSAPSRAPERRAESSTHTVAAGDTLFALARKYDTTPAAIAEASGISANTGLRVGQKLTIPGQGGSTPARAEPAVERPAPVTSRPNQVRPAREEAVAEAPVASDAPGGGRVITVDGPAKTYTVKKGDNLDEIADRMGMSRRELASLNGLKSPYRLTVGQRLKGEATKAKAYVVESGDTLAVVAQRFGVTARALAAENNLRSTAKLKSGQRLILPDGYRDRGVPKPAVSTPAPVRETTPAPTTAPSAPLPSAPQPYNGTPTRPTTPPATSSRPQIADAPPSLSETEIVAAGKGRFVWPLTGEILSDFGPKAGSQRNDGLNIRANAGEAVRSAAAGEVVYSGDQVPGFGNLVLVKHADGWVTAYAHLGRTDVKMRQQVVQGQQIGQAGSTGGVAEPQLHFEVRYAPSPKEKARPINPSLVLPQ
jgi:murein DD-endopeptidase MepM/ murein hydrolase activator NlpD